MNASGFIFDGINSEIYDLLICYFSNSSGVNNITSIGEIDVITDKATCSSKWKHYNTTYSKPLEFSFQISKKTFKEFDTREQANINRWLVKFDDYKWLQFNDPEYFNIYYNVKCTKLEKMEINHKCYGFEVTFIADSAFGYSPEIRKKFDIIKPNQVEFITNNSNELSCIYPLITVKVNSDCAFFIANTFTGEKIELHNCLADEIIIFDNENKIITSSKRKAHKLHSDFNFSWFKLYNSNTNRINQLIFSGNALVEFTYREIRKVGV